MKSRLLGREDVNQHQKTGLLAEPGNAKDLANCLLQLVRDRRLVTQLGHSARDFAKTHLTAEKMAAEIERTYRSAG